MANLNHEQFKVFDQMEEMDREHPTPAYTANKNARLFHGTTANIKDGMVRTANAVDKNVSEYSMGDPGDMSEGDHAFVTNDEGYAWQAAANFHKNGRRPRVYETEPAPDMKPGPWNKEHPDFLHHVEYGDPEEYPPHENPDAHAEALKQHQPEWASPNGFKVKQRIDIAPGRQGTFPSINWNQYKKDAATADRSDPRTVLFHARIGPDVNHPTDEQIKWGHGGEPTKQQVEKAMPAHLSGDQFHDWGKDPAPHSILREEMGRAQRRRATLFD
jgi:hypothetical protein